VIIHTYMEVPQGNSLCSYLKEAKMLFFSLSFAESENRREERALPGGWGEFDASGKGEEAGKNYRK
jgi:hypothetical protein